MSLALYCLAVLSGTITLFWCVVLPKSRKDSTLPPGPPGDPVIGNLRHMPTEQSALVFHEWSKKYVLGRRIIILDIHQADVDLLEKRSSNCSDRPVFTLYELLGRSPSLPFMQYGKRCTTRAPLVFEPAQHRQLQGDTNAGGSDVGTKSGGFRNRFATRIISQIVAGHRIISNDDWYLQASNMVYEAMTRTGPPGSSPIDFLPALQYFPNWFPGTSHMGVVKRWRPTVWELHDYPNLGNARSSFILAQLEEMGDEKHDHDLAGAAATMFGAEEATTWSTLTVFILAMILHPECQVKAQKEIDSVVGDLLLPDFEDRENLPFVDCILQAVLHVGKIPFSMQRHVTAWDLGTASE
ncbi:cytochrome P450 [Mycena rosella]|uniref:Cytochrome P450 n=1 Tax=Mycena rosella TaxID=1033263 RepID=A0AAD7CM16_MYCRO|nr:cytochrome P450 [Mycena rosella]